MSLSPTDTPSPASPPFNGLSRRDAMSASLARNWWAMALRGALAIVVGLIAILVPVAAMFSLALVFGVYLVVDGAFGIVAAARAAQHHERWGLLLAEGVLGIAVGVLVAIYPAGAVLGFVLLAAAWALVTGVLMLVASFRLHASHGRVWLALGGIVSIVWAVVLAGSPLVGALVLTWWLGGYAIAFGVMMLVLAFKLRAHAR